MIISMHNNWDDAKTEHDIYLNNIINTALSRIGHYTSDTLDFLRSVKDALVSEDLDDIKSSIVRFSQLKSSLSETNSKKLISELKTIFDYSTFSNKNTRGWNAYSLCKKSKLRICPYCHHNYAITVYRDKKNILRPTLDHFYPKSKYPHLALSLANLVPSCYSCNSSLKGNKDFYTKPHLHPLFDKETISFSCTHPKLTIPEIIGKFSSLKDELGIELTWPSTCKSSAESAKLFALNERYSQLDREGIEFIDSQITIETILGNKAVTAQKNASETEEIDIDASILKTRLLRFERDDYKEYLLGKLYADLHDQFHREISF